MKEQTEKLYARWIFGLASMAGLTIATVAVIFVVGSLFG